MDQCISLESPRISLSLGALLSSRDIRLTLEIERAGDCTMYTRGRAEMDIGSGNKLKIGRTGDTDNRSGVK